MSTEQSTVEKPTPSPTALSEKKSEAKLPKTKTYIKLKTKGGGDCAFHAILGVWDETAQQVMCAQVSAKRETLSTAIRTNTAVRELVISGIRELIMSGRSIGEQHRQLQKRYRQFLTDQNRLSSTLWSTFAEELSKYPQITDFITPPDKEKKKTDTKPAISSAQFYAALEREEGVLYGLMFSIPPLHAAFQEYNQLYNTDFDWPNAVSPEVVREYADFVKTPRTWLLPSELAIIAQVFKLSVDYYPYPGAAVMLFNPGQSTLVAVQFNGTDHFEQLRSPPPTPKENKTPVQEKAPDLSNLQPSGTTLTLPLPASTSSTQPTETKSTDSSLNEPDMSLDMSAWRIELFASLKASLSATTVENCPAAQLTTESQSNNTILIGSG